MSNAPESKKRSIGPIILLCHRPVGPREKAPFGPLSC